MDRLFDELQRLFFLPDQQGFLLGPAGEPPAGPLTPALVAAGLAEAGTPALAPVAADGCTRLLAIDFLRPAHWPQAAQVWQGVQADFDLPAPAVSVAAAGGYRLWFSLAEAVPAADGLAFLAGLGRRYLAEVPEAACRFHPAAGPGGWLDLPPARTRAGGKWSAFIDPAMGSMFMAEPGLEMAPGPGKQADILAGFRSMPADDFRRVLGVLAPAQAGGASPAPAALGASAPFTDPKSFLLAVMNDPSASPADRIEAAKALLPYFERGRP